MLPDRASREGKIAAPENSAMDELSVRNGSSAAAIPDESRPTILVVDDDHTANKVIAHYLLRRLQCRAGI